MFVLSGKKLAIETVQYFATAVFHVQNALDILLAPSNFVLANPAAKGQAETREDDVR